VTVAERMEADGWVHDYNSDSWDATKHGFRVTAASHGAFVYADDGSCLFFGRTDDVVGNAKLAVEAARKRSWVIGAPAARRLARKGKR